MTQLRFQRTCIIIIAAILPFDELFFLPSMLACDQLCDPTLTSSIALEVVHFCFVFFKTGNGAVRNALLKKQKKKKKQASVPGPGIVTVARFMNQ